MSKIFISYSHKDEEWKDKLTDHLKVLEMEGYCTLWDDRKIEMGDDWFPEIEKALKKAQIVIMMISDHFLTSNFIWKEEVPRILERRRKEGVRVIPIIVKPCAWETVQWLASIQLVPKDGKPLSTGKDHEIDEELASLVKKIAALIKKKDKPDEGIPFIPLPPENISISKLPTTGSKLFGREKRLKELDEAWADENTHIVTLAAWGGVGKTALVNHWLNLIERKNYCGANKVYGWSFYSQGAEEGKQASADEFMQETLKWFGDSNPEEGSDFEKGRRLARLVQKEKSLLILDGMEPMQYPPGEVHGFDGKLKDQGMRAFLRELAGSNPGLCVITTRERATDLADKMGFTVKEMNLEHLSDDAGALLLKSLGVVGSDKDMEKAVKEYDGHALALTLLGQYTKSVYKGDIRKRDKIPRLTQERLQGRHARRVMEAYERWWGESPERDILYIMGLFDRPVDIDAVETLKKDPPIPGVTEQLKQLNEEDWGYVLTNLRTANLLAKENPENPDTFDCHPLIREHFSQKFQQQNLNGWKEAHKRLYHYYKNLPDKDLPDTLQEMEPLFAAVAHGCHAGLYQEAMDDVYYSRILRDGNTSYCCKKLGAFSADLAVLSHFFKVPWSEPVEGLVDLYKIGVFNWAGFHLCALGRLQEAIQPLKAGLDMRIKQNAFLSASINANSLSNLMLLLGRIEEAIEYTHQGIDYADRTLEWGHQFVNRTTLAYALYQSGQLEKAEKLFREAETMQKKLMSKPQFLYSVPGFRFCDYLLNQGKYSEVIERSEQILKWDKQDQPLLDIALHKLNLGRAWMMQAVEEGSSDFTRAIDSLNQAVEGLWEASYQDYTPLGLLARAECYRLQKQFSKAWDDLQEAKEIAELGSMKLHLCDYHLEAGRLCEAEGKTEEAERHFDTAAKMIEETGYHRRDKEVKKMKRK